MMSAPDPRFPVFDLIVLGDDAAGAAAAAAVARLGRAVALAPTGHEALHAPPLVEPQNFVWRTLDLHRRFAGGQGFAAEVLIGETLLELPAERRAAARALAMRAEALGGLYEEFAAAETLAPDYESADAVLDDWFEDEALKAKIAEASTLPCGAEVAENWSRSIASLAGELEAALAPVGSADQFPGDPLLADVATKSGRDPWVERFALTAFAAWAAGDDADAVRRIHIARSWSSERRDPRGQIWARFLATLLHELRRDWEAVLEAAADIDPLADRHGITAWHGSGAGLSFWADCQRRSDRDFPSERLARIFLDRGSSADTSFRSAMLLLAGRSYAWRRELARAAAALDEAISFCSKTQERLLLAEALRNRALLASAEGDRGGARLLLERATRVAREQGALTLEVRALCASIRLGLAGSPGERDRLRALEKQARSLGASERLRIASLPL